MARTRLDRKTKTKMQEIVQAGTNYLDAATILNENGFTTPMGKMFTAQAVSYYMCKNGHRQNRKYRRKVEGIVSAGIKNVMASQDLDDNTKMIVTKSLLVPRNLEV